MTSVSIWRYKDYSSFTAQEVDFEAIQNGADIEERNEEGLTPLMYQVSDAFSSWGDSVPKVFDEDLEILKALLAHKADVNAVTSDGKTALMISLEEGFCDDDRVFALLFEASADVNMRSNKNFSALDFAIETNNLKCAVTLVELGGKWDVINGWREYSLDIENHWDYKRLAKAFPKALRKKRKSIPFARKLLKKIFEDVVVEIVLDFVICDANVKS